MSCRHSATYRAATHCPECRARREALPSPVTFRRVTLRGSVTDYSDLASPCCGAGEHRPGGGPWFCMDCGTSRPDEPPARRR